MADNRDISTSTQKKRELTISNIGALMKIQERYIYHKNSFITEDAENKWRVLPPTVSQVELE